LAYTSQSPVRLRKQPSLLEQHEKHSILFRRPDGSHSDIFYIFSIIELISVLEQQYSTLTVPKCAIAHGSSTVGTATNNPHKKISKTHFNIILPFPSKLCISDTIICKMLSAIPFWAECCIIQLQGRYGSFGCCKCGGLPVSEDVCRVRREIL
jgi:hypothetical protein